MGLENETTVWRPSQLASEGPRYLALLNSIEKDIAAGLLADGDRLPPHRDLARDLELSVGTVSKAYQEAEQRGIVSSRVGHGTFVRRRPRPVANAERHSEPFNLALNVPAHESETEVLSLVMGNVVADSGFAEMLKYHPHAGIPRHREILSSALSDDHFTIDPARTLLCNGAQHAIDIAIRCVTKAGDSVLVDSLTYSGFKAIALSNHLKLVPVRMDDEGMSPQDLREMCERSKARVLYCMPTLHSPTARTMSLQRRKAIAELAEEFDLTIIEDDAYGSFCEMRPQPIAAMAPMRSFYITSFSKFVAPGFRLGTLTAPAKLINQAELLLHASAWFVAPMLGEVASQLVQTGKFEQLLAMRRNQAASRYQVFADIFPEAAKLPYPAFFGWLPLGQGWTAEQFAAAARGRGILITPPIASSVNDEDPGGVRICFGSPRQIDELSVLLTNLRDVLSLRPLTVVSVA